jgi:hypothetical protein
MNSAIDSLEQKYPNNIVLVTKQIIKRNFFLAGSLMLDWSRGKNWLIPQ